ncbi:molybdenum cofactor guanylyltransferase [Sinirhodobacter ferrireducens]|uniref:Molybdenum cofactor guanylyltransferase n=1 Tax=Paenirhodobacter ferrireducens TaxID=1215032 RepID=A0A443LQB8_9RHOB|nr:molybdenum cofactor guanylyltransferase MobA [Sinirhodobacter ferrireducens]RWR51356.1 molybdenum cofactor guanylyltransferase [Sinirhodobacter ferrireducens]
MRIAGLILAGGQGRRMGGVAKALLPLSGRPLAAHVIARLAPQVGALALSANGDPVRFAGFGLPVLADLPGEVGEGPLAGLRAGLRWAAAEGAGALVTAATDTPFLPGDLVARLAAPGGAAFATWRGRAHYTAALWPLSEAARIGALFAAGERRLRVALGTATEVAFDDLPEDPFANLNTPEDLAAAAVRIGEAR